MKSHWVSAAVVGLICLLAVQVAVTTAATGSSGASASGTSKGKVSIHLEGERLGPHRASGRFTLSGAISDRGEFSEYVSFGRVGPETSRMKAVRTLIGARGTIWTRSECIALHGLCRGTHPWEITKGSEAYAGISGGGQETRHLPAPPLPPNIGHLDISMRGSVFVPTAATRIVSGAARMSAKIAFVRDHELYVMNADGSEQWQLAPAAQPVTPAWSPDAHAIAFVSKRDGNPDVHVVNADGSGHLNLTRNPTRDGSPAWSPDGRKIAFVRWHGGPDVYVMNADGSGQRNLTSNPASDVNPVWSPDGRRIAFVRKVGFVAPPRLNVRSGFRILFRSYLYVVDADGSGLRTLTRDPLYGGAPSPVWSPDGGAIHFGRYVVDADGSRVQRLKRDFPQAGVWSPDGRRIAFVRAFHRGSPVADYEIYVVNADGTGLRRLTRSLGGDSRPVWSPDGRQIAFRSVRDGNPEIYVMNADGRGQQNLTRSPATDGWFTWSPAQSTASRRMSAASPNMASLGTVRIRLKGWLTGPQFAAIGRGRFTLSGAISDRGRFVDRDFQGVHPEIDPHVRILFGTKGTIRIAVDGKRSWRITDGTKEYAGLGGRGRTSGVYRSGSIIDITMRGTVSR